MRMRWIEKRLMNTAARTWVLRRLEAPRVLANLKLPPGSECLEIGCGQGAGALCSVKYLGPDRLVCADSDPEMIEAAKRYVATPLRWAKDVDASRIEFLCRNAAELPFAAETFDAAFLFGALHHIQRWQQAITEVHRVLRPGGVFSFGEALLSRSIFFLNRYWRHVPFGRRDILRALEQAGFTVRSFHTTLFGHWCFVRATK